MDSKIVISNTSPLLFLHRAGCLDVLRQLYDTIIVPVAVEQELKVGLQRGLDGPSISGLSWIEIRSVTSPALLPSVVDLGRGEAEVIALGMELESFSGREVLHILDDQLARRIADLNRLTYTGTLGVVIKAKQQGYLESAGEVIRAMQASGMWIGEAVVTAALKLAGEEQP